MPMLTPEEPKRPLPAETASFPSPVPTQVVSSDEYFPTPRRKRVEARTKALGAEYAPLGPAGSDHRHGCVVRG